METSEKKMNQHWMRKFIPIWSAQIFSLLGQRTGPVRARLVDHAKNRFGCVAGHRHSGGSPARSIPGAFCRRPGGPLEPPQGDDRCGRESLPC